jgi:hypothetical protein
VKVSRRTALKSIAAVPLIPLQAERPDDRILAAIAEVVLPSDTDRAAAVAAFVTWHADYKENADTDHGYGNTRLRTTGPRPDRDYPSQIAALEAAARAAGAAGFAAAPVEQRRRILQSAIAEAKVERLPARPTGAHIATDLMGHYFGSAAATDLCYRAAIRRDDCRGLEGSDRPPRALR